MSLTGRSAAPAQKRVAVQRFSSIAAAKRLREDDNDGDAAVPRARFKSPIFALSQGRSVFRFRLLCCIRTLLQPFLLETGMAWFGFAKVLRVTDAEAHLIHLEPVAGEANAYRANMRSVWAEPLCAVLAVDANYDERAGYYSLRTSVADILKLLE